MRGLLAGLLATLLFMNILRLIGTALAAMMTLSVFAQEPQPAPDYRAHILTPPAPAAPRINGPKVYGVRPGADFLFRIPATGERPMTFEAKGLPRGTVAIAGTAFETTRPGDALYSEAAPRTRRRRFVAIPYALWQNRGPAEMQVWTREA